MVEVTSWSCGVFLRHRPIVRIAGRVTVAFFLFDDCVTMVALGVFAALITTVSLMRIVQVL